MRGLQQPSIMALSRVHRVAGTHVGKSKVIRDGHDGRERVVFGGDPPCTMRIIVGARAGAADSGARVQQTGGDEHRGGDDAATQK